MGIDPAQLIELLQLLIENKNENNKNDDFLFFFSLFFFFFLFHAFCLLSKSLLPRDSLQAPGASPLILEKGDKFKGQNSSFGNVRERSKSVYNIESCFDHGRHITATALRTFTAAIYYCYHSLLFIIIFPCI